MRRLPLPPTPEGTRYPYQIIPNSEQCDLCQYFGHKFLKNQAAFDSLPAACSCAVSSIGSVLSKKPSMASAGIL